MENVLVALAIITAFMFIAYKFKKSVINGECGCGECKCSLKKTEGCPNGPNPLKKK